MEKPKILVVEDDEAIRTQMKWALAQDYDVYLAQDGSSAMEAMKTHLPQLITLDLGLPPSPEDTTEGLKTLSSILHLDPLAKVIIVSGNPDKQAALEAISIGAHDFFTKPIVTDELKYILKRAAYVQRLEVQYRELQKQLKGHAFGEILGSSPKMQHIFATVRKVATNDVPVLITGESGTGKELVARAIHSKSVRCSGPFIAINCGAIPENLLESELFGHEKGSFTGAHQTRPGKVEMAQGGTLFLDEIGEMPLQLQVKLLRFLQDSKIERIGGRKVIDINARVLAATNKELGALVADNRFREDLYYRLAVVTMELPPLRDRDDDALQLAKAFMQKYSSGPAAKTLSHEAKLAIAAYRWPGNVRELENRVRRALTLAETNAITPTDLGLAETEALPLSLNLKKAKEELEIRLINAAMEKNNGNLSKSADDLGLTRPTLYSIMKKNNMIKEHREVLDKSQTTD
ncbi:MAG: PEP-CTERM-box response regulator transcription factor [Deltaproteobacteria bacterium]